MADERDAGSYDERLTYGASHAYCEPPPPPWTWVVAEFFRRHGRTLALCLPAVLAGGGVAAIAAGAMLAPDRLDARYRQAAAQAVKAGDYERARIGFERLIQRGGQTEDAELGLAIVLATLGETDRSEAILDRLTPVGGPGHVPAHLWRADRLIRPGPLPPEAARAAEFHLLRVLDDEPDSSEAHALLGQLYARTGRTSAAATHLEKASSAYPELLLALAEVATQQGQHDVARDRMASAARVFRARVSMQPTDRAARMVYAVALSALREYRQAEAVLQEGRAADGDSSAYRQALAAVYVAWSDAEAKRSTSDLGARLDLLVRGLRLDPAKGELLQRLAEVLDGGGPGAESVRASLRALLAEGQAATAVHFLLGIDDWRGGRFASARLHWEMAHRAAPELALVANNLAWALASGPDPDLARALDLIDQAIDRTPDEPRLRGTRGRVLARQGRWREALLDLEAALPADRSGRELHRDLADAYTALGDPAAAAEHRRRAEAVR